LEKEETTTCSDQFFHSVGLGIKNKNGTAIVQ
jgi:hypothetical protein